MMTIFLLATLSLTLTLAAMLAAVKRLAGSNRQVALCLLGILACGVSLGATGGVSGTYA